MRHLLEMDDLGESELTRILDLADPTRAEPVLTGRGVALIFEKPSNRTRNSCEVAVFELGGHPVSIQAEEVGLGVRETVEDVTRVLGRYHAIVGARVFDHRNLTAMAAIDAVPVINLLSDLAHPCQTLADLLTLRQRWGSLAGRTVAWVGDGNNVARSLLIGCALAGVHVRLACPPGHAADPSAVGWARSRGIDVIETEDPLEGAAGADAVYTDVWVSMGQEAEAAQRLDAFDRYRVDERVMGAAAHGAVFLHCLPAHRGQEVSAGVIDGPASAVWDQAENRLHAVRGLMMWLARQ